MKYVKKLVTEDLRRLVGATEGCILVDFRGLSAKESDELRRRLRSRGVRMNVVPNRLYRRALAERYGDLGPAETLDQILTGPTAVVFGSDGAIAAAKVLLEWRRDKERPQIKGALFDRRVLDAAGVGELASLPTKEVLVAQIASLVVEPIRGIAAALEGVARSLAYAVGAIAEKKQGEHDTASTSS